MAKTKYIILALVLSPLVFFYTNCEKLSPNSGQESQASCTAPDCASSNTNTNVSPTSTPTAITAKCKPELKKIVFETLTWSELPTKQTIVTGTTGAASKLSTTTSTTYRGYFSAAATSSTGGLTRQMWFSNCPGGEPIMQSYTIGGILKNKCDVSGAEIKLSWSQEDNPAFSTTTCKLQRNKIYYLNYAQASFGVGLEPSTTSALIRGASTSGTP